MTINIADPQVLLLIFGAGLIVRSLYSIKRWWDLGWWAFAWFFAVAIVLKMYGDDNPTQEQFLLSIFLTFAFGVTLLLYRNILPRVREHSLLLLTVIFLYCFIKYALFSYAGTEYLLLLALIPSSLVIYLSFVNLQLSHYSKLFFYVWFILMNIFFIFFYLFSKEISLWDYSTLQFSSPYDAFLTGFTAFSLMANLCFIYMLVLPGGKNDSWEERKRIWKEYVGVIVSRHDDSQLHLYQTILILIVAGGGLVINYFFNIFSDGVIIPTYLFLSQLFISIPPINKNVVKPQVLTSPPA